MPLLPTGVLPSRLKQQYFSTNCSAHWDASVWKAGSWIYFSIYPSGQHRLFTSVVKNPGNGQYNRLICLKAARQQHRDHCKAAIKTSTNRKSVFSTWPLFGLNLVSKPNWLVVTIAGSLSGSGPPERITAACGPSSQAPMFSAFASSLRVEPGEVLIHHVRAQKNRLASVSLSGPPERIRTSDLCLRRAALYPAELRAVYGVSRG